MGAGPCACLLALRPKGLIAMRFGAQPKPPGLTYPLSPLLGRLAQRVDERQEIGFGEASRGSGDDGAVSVDRDPVGETGQTKPGSKALIRSRSTHLRDRARKEDRGEHSFKRADAVHAAKRMEA